MAFKRPGVYITETLTPLANTVEAGSGSTAVFVGTNAAGGPLAPTVVNSWSQFAQTYRGFGNTADLLPYAVYEYFNNGGGSCVVIRAANATAIVASTTLTDSTGSDGVDLLKVSANAPGKWGNDVVVDVSASAAASPTHFDLLVTLDGRTERFTDVSLDPTSSRFLPNIVNSPYAGSTLVQVEYVGPADWTNADTPAPVEGRNLTGGAEGAGTPDLVAATQRLENVVGIFDVNLPGVNSNTVINPLLAWAEAQGNIFLVIDGVEGSLTDNPSANAAAQQALLTGGSALTGLSVGSLYAPWQVADDPSSTVGGAQRLLPPGGFVLGQYARTDTLRGVQKPAAGLDASVRGVLGPQFQYSQTDLDNLNVTGVNVLKVVPGRGTCIFGARTLSTGMPDRYLSIRRSLISLKFGLTNLTRFAIFEDNDGDLRQQVSDLCEQYLRTVWAQGVLAGGSEAEAFFVKCDDENNPPSSVAQGVINITVGVSLQTPAEYIVFNIGQTVSGATTDES